LGLNCRSPGSDLVALALLVGWLIAGAFQSRSVKGGGCVFPLVSDQRAGVDRRSSFDYRSDLGIASV